jgi:hypothetical protein
MVSERKSMMDLQEMVRLYQLGTGYRRVAALLGMSPNTERAYRQVLANASLLTGSASDRPKSRRCRRLSMACTHPELLRSRFRVRRAEQR